MTDSIPTLADMPLQPIVAMATLASNPEVEIPKLISQMVSGLSEANLLMSQHHLFTIVGPTILHLKCNTRHWSKASFTEWLGQARQR